MIRTIRLCWISSRALGTCKGPSKEDVRNKFQHFFLQHDHVQVPSSSVIPKVGEARAFIRDGSEQFKQIFAMEVVPEHNRVFNWQRCLRVNNSHVVGRDLHQHTFYEMLGNWAFNEVNEANSKREACELAWEFLTEIVNISPERIYISYFGGSEKLGLGPDTKTREIWKAIGEADGSLSVLPSTHVDTGMNLERLTSFLQNVPSIYDTDAFQPIFAEIEALGGPKYMASSSPTDVSLRIIADHLRGFCVAIADGVKPGSRGRSLHVRKLLRKAFYHTHRVGLPQGSSGLLAETALNLLSPAYPSFRDELSWWRFEKKR